MRSHRHRRRNVQRSVCRAEKRLPEPTVIGWDRLAELDRDDDPDELREDDEPCPQDD